MSWHGQVCPSLSRYDQVSISHKIEIWLLPKILTVSNETVTPWSMIASVANPTTLLVDLKLFHILRQLTYRLRS